MFQEHLRELIEDQVNPVELAALLPAKRYEKFDLYVDETLLDKANASDRIDLPEAKQAAQNALALPILIRSVGVIGLMD